MSTFTQKTPQLSPRLLLQHFPTDLNLICWRYVSFVSDLCLLADPSVFFKGKKCKGVEGLLPEGKELMEEDSEQVVLDGGLIAAAQRVEHYEIASYGSARAFTPTPARPHYSIVVPAFNEKSRIGPTLQNLLDHLQKQQWSAEIIVVDDGSRDETPQIVSRFAAMHPEVRLVRNPGNCGKGFAVRNGMLHTRGNFVLFTDADLSSPICEASKLFSALENGAEMAIGSRWLDPSLQLERQSVQRRLLSRIFNIFLRITLGLTARDTQCGFKAFTRRAVNIVFPLQQVHHFGFDAEILYLGRRFGLKVIEVPVVFRHDDRSTVNPLKDGIRMGMDVLRVCWYSLTGKYSRP